MMMMMMHIEELRAYCLSKKGVTEELPFGPDTLVFKVLGKIFALTGLDSPQLSVNLKADPEQAILQREQFACVQPGYHMNKKHWNTVLIDGTVPAAQVKLWIDDSYSLVVSSLPRKTQLELAKS